jgi:hypothetical protein
MPARFEVATYFGQRAVLDAVAEAAHQTEHEREIMYGGEAIRQ